MKFFYLNLGCKSEETLIQQLEGRGHQAALVSGSHNEWYMDHINFRDRRDLDFNPSGSGLLPTKLYLIETSNFVEMTKPLRNRYLLSGAWGSDSVWNEWATKSLRFWYSVLIENNIELLIFNGSPHHLYTFALYNSAKSVGIPTILLEKTDIEGRIVAKRSLLNEYVIPKSNDIKKESTNNNSFEFGAEAYWLQAKKQSVSITGRVKNNFDRSKRLGLCGIFFGRCIYDDRSLITRLYVKCRSKFINKVLFFLFRFRLCIDVVKERFNRKAKQICIFLQVEPEKNCFPCGGDFFDQAMLLERVIGRIHSSRVVIKEHPSQFSSWQSAWQGRKIRFYLIGLFNSRVIFTNKMPVCLNNESVKLGFLTLGGSLGLDLLRANKNCKIIGYPWYQYGYSEGNVSKEAVDSFLDGLAADGDLENSDKLKNSLDGFQFPGSVSKWCKVETLDWVELIESIESAVEENAR